MLEEDRDILVVCYEYDFGTCEHKAYVEELKHGEDSHLGMNVVAVMGGRLCPEHEDRAKNCLWCSRIRVRCSARRIY